MPSDLFVVSQTTPHPRCGVLLGTVLGVLGLLPTPKRKTIRISGFEIDALDAVRYAGQWVALDRETVQILASDSMPGSLRSTMRERFLGRTYTMILFPRSR